MRSASYGAAAEKLVGLDAASVNPDLIGDSGLVPKGGALATQPITASVTALALNFTATIKPFEQNVGPLLEAAQAPFDIVGPSTDLQFDPTNDFVYTDTKRAYYVTATRYYEYGSQWRPVAPSNPADAPFEVRYYFHRFYHPYTKLFWHEIFNSGLAGLYTTTMQTQPDKVDPAAGDTFSFQTSYQPAVGRVNWGEDNEIIDFSASAATPCTTGSCSFTCRFTSRRRSSSISNSTTLSPGWVTSSTRSRLVPERRPSGSG